MLSHYTPEQRLAGLDRDQRAGQTLDHDTRCHNPGRFKPSAATGGPLART